MLANDVMHYLEVKIASLAFDSMRLKAEVRLKSSEMIYQGLAVAILPASNLSIKGDFKHVKTYQTPQAHVQDQQQ